MNNQLTTEQKAVIYAQYLGQRITPEDDERPLYLHQVDTFRRLLRANHADEVTAYGLDADAPKVLLRPLSAITDEDAIEVAKSIFRDRDFEILSRNENHMTLCNEGYEVELWYAEGSRFNVSMYFAEARLMRAKINMEFEVSAIITQVLIQRGYAVPLFIAPGHPLNGKTAIELGLAIAVTDENTPV